MPPEVPVVVSPRVPELVTGDPVTPKIEAAGTLSPTEVTVPLLMAAMVKVSPPLGVIVIPLPAESVRAPVNVLRLVTPPDPFFGGQS